MKDIEIHNLIMEYSLDNNYRLLLGNAIRKKRKESKLTQKQLAAIVGITYQQIQKYESGNSGISVDMLLRISDALNADISEFFTQNALNDNKPVYTDEYTQQIIKKVSEINNTEVKLAILGMINIITRIFKS